MQRREARQLKTKVLNTTTTLASSSHVYITHVTRSYRSDPGKSPSIKPISTEGSCDLSIPLQILKMCVSHFPKAVHLCRF